MKKMLKRATITLLCLALMVPAIIQGIPALGTSAKQPFSGDDFESYANSTDFLEVWETVPVLSGLPNITANDARVDSNPPGEKTGKAMRNAFSIGGGNVRKYATVVKEDKWNIDVLKGYSFHQYYNLGTTSTYDYNPAYIIYFAGQDDSYVIDVQIDYGNGKIIARRGKNGTITGTTKELSGINYYDSSSTSNYDPWVKVDVVYNYTIADNVLTGLVADVYFSNKHTEPILAFAVTIDNPQTGFRVGIAPTISSITGARWLDDFTFDGDTFEGLAIEYCATYQAILSKTPETVTSADETACNTALAALDGLFPEVRALLSEEEALLIELAANCTDSPDEIELATGSTYEIDRDGDFLLNVAENTTVANLLSQLDGGEDEHTVTGLALADIVYTGAVVVLGDDVDKLTVVIKGDSGDGFVRIDDLLLMKQYILSQETTLAPAVAKAFELDDQSGITDDDLALLEKHLLKKENLFGFSQG